MLVSQTNRIEFTKLLSTRVTFFGSPTGDEKDRHFLWSSEPRDGLAIYREKAAFLFLSFFKVMLHETIRNDDF